MGDRWRCSQHGWRILCTAVFVGWGSEGWGKEGSSDVEAYLTQDFGWPAGAVQEQLEQDSTMVPYGKGALFVPSMTAGLDEPPILVLQDGESVAEGTTGKRIILPPGEYDVRVGSGARQQRIQISANVRELETTIVPIKWSSLQVHVVDEQYGSLRASYEIIRVSDREYMGIGFGTNEQAGEPLSTWILKPGLYKIVRVGDTYRARRDFVTVRLVESSHTDVLLVLNAATGEFAGGGAVPRRDLFRAQDGFFGSLVLGGDVSLNDRSNVVGLPDGLSFAFRGFVDGRFSIELFDNPLILQLQIEQGQSKSPNLPWQKTNDRVDLDGLYVYQLEPWIGPYIRFGVETNVLPGSQGLETPATVRYLANDRCNSADPACVVREESQAHEVELSPPLGLTTIKEGVGLNLRVLKTLFAETTLRAGFGARHRLTQDLYELADGFSIGDSSLNYVPIATSNQAGMEVTVLSILRLTRYVLINLEADMLLTPDDFEQSVVELETSVALKLTSYVSVNYVLRYLRDKALSDDDRLQQDLLVRFSVELL